jgi:hypothetical protein
MSLCLGFVHIVTQENNLSLGEVNIALSHISVQ